MRRIGRSARLLAACWLMAVPTAGTADEGPPAPMSVDQLLQTWEEHASSITFLEARFIITTVSPAWGSKKQAGRLVLGLPNQAVVELSPIDPDGRLMPPESRLAWTGRATMFFDYPSRIAFRTRMTAERFGPPELACLPFFFKMTVVEAKARYDWEITGQNDSVVAVKVRAKGGRKIGEDYQSCVIVLDRHTYLPRKLFTFPSNPSQDRVEYLLTGLVLNKPFDISALADPPSQGWRFSDYGKWDAAGFLRGLWTTRIVE